MIRILTGLMIACLAIGCGGHAQTSPGSGVFDPDTVEIADRPAVLADPAAKLDKLSLRGVRLGDPRSAVTIQRKLTEDDRGWITTRDSCRYRILNDQIVTLGVWDRNILDQLNVSNQEDLVRVFGKPEKTESLKALTGESVIYTYDGGNKRVIYSKFENRLTAVNLGAAYATSRSGE